MYKKGTIVLVPFPFTNLSAHKVRPAIILSQERAGDDVVVAFISSHPKQRVHAMDVPIRSTHPSFEKTGLKANSVIKVDKIATLSKKIVLGELGSVDKTTEEQIDIKMRRLFKI